VCVCVCVFDKCLVRMSCAKMWACATQNRQPAAPAADCRTRTHPLTAWWRLDRHQAVNRGRSQRPLSSNSISIAMPAPCFTKTRRHLEMLPGSTLGCVRHLDLAHGGYITPLMVQLLFLASAQSLQSLCATYPTGAEVRVSVVRASLLVHCSCPHPQEVRVW